jgi:hypothetical protein
MSKDPTIPPPAEATQSTAPSGPPASAPAAPAPTPAEALASARQVEELADRLSACADSIHERILRDIRRHDGGPVPASQQAAARALLDAETELRQRADRLYADAAACIVAGLGRPQAQLVRLTIDAAARIARIVRIGDGITLVARLLGLAAAAATGQAGPIIVAIDALKTQLDTAAANNPPA